MKKTRHNGWIWGTSTNKTLSLFLSLILTVTLNGNIFEIRVRVKPISCVLCDLPHPEFLLVTTTFCLAPPCKSCDGATVETVFVTALLLKRNHSLCHSRKWISFWICKFEFSTEKDSSLISSLAVSLNLPGEFLNDIVTVWPLFWGVYPAGSFEVWGQKQNVVSAIFRIDLSVNNVEVESTSCMMTLSHWQRRNGTQPFNYILPVPTQPRWQHVYCLC